MLQKKRSTTESLELLETVPTDVVHENIDDYKSLNDKCDKVIIKIKNRKESKAKKKKY